MNRPLVFQVSATGAGQNKSRYLFTRIFEPYDYLITLFPELKGKKWLTPYYEVKRWIIRLKSGRSTAIKKELSAILKEDTENSATGKMMKRLGL